MFPSSASVVRRSLPSPGSRRVRFPGFNGTTERSDSLRTLTTGFLFVLRAVTTPLRLSSSLPPGPTPARGPGVIVVRPPHRRRAGGVAGRPKFLGNPLVPMPCSQTPAGPESPGLTVLGRGPRQANTEGYPRVTQSRGSIARLEHALSTLRPDPHGPRRKTRFRLPARLYRVGFASPQGSNERFLRCTRLHPSSFPKLAWRNGHLWPCVNPLSLPDNS
jgi:hypothetical protein